MSKQKIHKGNQSKKFSWVASTLCKFYGSENHHFLYSDKWKEVTCKRCLNKKKTRKAGDR